MINRILFCLRVACALGLLTACGPQSAGTDSSQSTTNAAPPTEAQAGAKDDVPSFDPDKGLYLPEATRESMGIKTAPVQKKTFQAEWTMKFQVFREANEAPLPGMSYRSGSAYASTILTDLKPGLEVGQTGEVLEKASPKQAKLFQINALANSNQTEVLVEIADPQHQFALADFCAVRWQMASLNVPATVPDSALLKTTEGNFVYVQKADLLMRIEVKAGASGEGFTEITEGVSVGDNVVTDPVQMLWLTELKLKTGGSEP